MTMNVRGPGGKFLGGGGLGGGIGGFGEKFSIDIDIMSYFDDSGTQAAKKEIRELGDTTEEGGKKTGRTKEQAEAYSDSLRDSISPIRSVSWDLMLMGRSMSILNNLWGGHNQIVKEVTGVIYGAGAVMRIIVTAVDMYRVAILFTANAQVAQTALFVKETAAVGTLAGAYTALAIAKTAAIGVGIGGTGLVASGVGMGLLGFMQKGGTVNQTGPYVLHKGETVVPAGTNFSTININMSAGSISSSVDVDNMLDSMAKRMIIESRRRGVR